jgi:hypothetical protein
MKFVNYLSLTRNVIKFFGVRWLFFRMFYTFKLKTNIVKLCSPVHTWHKYLDKNQHKIPLNYRTGNAFTSEREDASRFFVNRKSYMTGEKILDVFDKEGITTPEYNTKNIQQGRFLLFSKIISDTGIPPEWNKNHLSNTALPQNKHWSQIDDFGNGDIKVIWELSRFSFIYDLVRTYSRTGDPEISALFWILIEDWCAVNIPNSGPNWKCGQETTFRLMASLLGFVWLSGIHLITSPDRVYKSLFRMIYFSGHQNR